MIVSLQLCLHDSVLSPWDTRFEYRVCDGDEPARNGDDDELVRLAAHLEALRDRFQNRIVTSGGKCGLEQDMSQRAPSSCDCSPASRHPTVVWDR